MDSTWVFGPSALLEGCCGIKRSIGARSIASGTYVAYRNISSHTSKARSAWVVLGLLIDMDDRTECFGFNRRHWYVNHWQIWKKIRINRCSPIRQVSLQQDDAS